MATKITQTCDQCSTDVSDYHLTRAIAFNNGARLSFHAWSDKLAQEPKALHFHNDLCARRFLENWLCEQRLKEEAPVVPVQESDSAVKPPLVPIIDGQWAEVGEAKPYAEAQAVEHPSEEPL